MIALIWFVLAALASPFESKIRLEAENAALRHRVIVLRRKLRGRVRLTNHGHWFFVQLYRWFPSILTVITIVQPERWLGGIGPAFVVIGIGNRARGEGARQSKRTCAR
jgi:hypothetical protein